MKRYEPPAIVEMVEESKGDWLKVEDVIKLLENIQDILKESDCYIRFIDDELETLK